MSDMAFGLATVTIGIVAVVAIVYGRSFKGGSGPRGVSVEISKDGDGQAAIGLAGDAPGSGRDAAAEGDVERSQD